MTALGTSNPGASGMEVHGSADRAQHLAMTSEHALTGIHGTDDTNQAEALQRHFLKVLRSDEADDARPVDDQRQFILLIIAGMALHDSVERTLSVQMASPAIILQRAAPAAARQSG